MPPPDTPSHPYGIGDASALTGLSVGALRRLERDGLIRPERTPGGHRLYSGEDLRRLQRIAYLRQMEHLNSAAIRRELGAQVEAGRHDGTAQTADVGQRLRAIRRSRGLSLASASKQAGVSPSFLSEVERGRARMSLGALFKVADAYGTTVPGLIHGHQPVAGHLTRAGDRATFRGTDERVTIDDLIAEPGALEAQWFEVESGGASGEAYTHPGEELVVVIAGRLEFRLGLDRHLLGPGDALHFESTVLHEWRNPEPERSIAIWVNAPVVDQPTRPGGRRRTAHTRGEPAAHVLP